MEPENPVPKVWPTILPTAIFLLLFFAGCIAYYIHSDPKGDSVRIEKEVACWHACADVNATVTDFFLQKLSETNTTLECECTDGEILSIEKPKNN